MSALLFAKMSLVILTHPKAMEARRAMATWTWGLAYTRDHQLDGRIPRDALRLAWVGYKQAVADAHVLVKVGLWSEDPDGMGWVMSKYARHNLTASQVIEKQKDGAKRVHKHRRQDDVTRYTPPISSTEIESEKEEESESEIHMGAAVQPAMSAPPGVDRMLAKHWNAPTEAEMRADIDAAFANLSHADGAVRLAGVDLSTLPTPAPVLTLPDRAKPARGKQLPDGWTPSPELAQQCARLAGEDCLTLVPAFTDHHRSRGSVMRDWDAAFRTWSRNHRRFAARGGPARVVQRTPEAGPAYEESDGELPEDFR